MPTRGGQRIIFTTPSCCIMSCGIKKDSKRPQQLPPCFIPHFIQIVRLSAVAPPPRHICISYMICTETVCVVNHPYKLIIIIIMLPCWPKLAGYIICQCGGGMRCVCSISIHISQKVIQLSVYLILYDFYVSYIPI